LDNCLASLPECLEALARTDQNGARDEEELAFGLLGSWMKELYVKDQEPRLAEDLALRSSTLQRLQALAAMGRPSFAIGVGQMLFLYFWWGAAPRGLSSIPGSAGLEGGGRLEGPDVEVAALAAQLHLVSISAAGCDLASTSLQDFETNKCPWRWRFVLLLFVELGRQLAVKFLDLPGAAAQLRAAEQHVATMRTLPYFAGHRSLRQGEGPYRANHNDDHLPRARHRPVWPREMWPSFATFLEANAHVFLAELQRLVDADEEFDEIFRTVQVQQTEFTPLPREWGLLDLIRHGNTTAACPYAPQSCALLAERPEVNGRCFSETRVPNAGVAFARLLPGTEIKPHFATEMRLAVHLGLITPPGPEMWVANETVRWTQGEAVVFDDTYFHGVQHTGLEARYVLLAWTCHPCDAEWRQNNGEEWLSENSLPDYCNS
ncbi:unnamed protein product, partial [Polarella glacialis]